MSWGHGGVNNAFPSAVVCRRSPLSTRPMSASPDPCVERRRCSGLPSASSALVSLPLERVLDVFELGDILKHF